MDEDWKKHVDSELARLRDSHHSLRNDMNAMRLQFTESLAALKEQIKDLNTEHLKNQGDLLLILERRFGAVDLAIQTQKTGAGIWSTVGSSIFAAIPAVIFFIYWLMSRNKS